MTSDATSLPECEDYIFKEKMKFMNMSMYKGILIFSGLVKCLFFSYLVKTQNFLVWNIGTSDIGVA